MNIGKKIGLLILIIIALVALALARELKEPEHKTTTVVGNTTSSEEPSVEFDGVTVAVEVAETNDERMRGLSGRTSLPPGTGMLFVFDTVGEYGFWMKDMQFAIDIVWLSSEGRVVHIVSDARPQSFPTIFKPTTPARYVLEVPSGFSALHGVAVGDVATLNL